MSEPVTLWALFRYAKHTRWATEPFGWATHADGGSKCSFTVDARPYLALPAAEFAALTRERDEAEAQVEAMSHVLAATKADLASARTALAEARGVLGEFRTRLKWSAREGEWILRPEVGDNLYTDDPLARIDALAGEGGA